MDFNIYRGDDYGEHDPMWTIELVDRDNQPLSFAGMSFLTTYKQQITPIDEDPDDNTALVKHRIDFDASGNAVTEVGLYFVEPGRIENWLTREETKSFPPEARILSDVQVIYPNGDVSTIADGHVVIARDSVTNREA